MKLPLFLKVSLCSMLVSSASAESFTTDFLGSEGYTAGALDASAQTEAPHFNETLVGGVYLPGGQGPDFGKAVRLPTAGSTTLYKRGFGSGFSAGDSWEVSMDFTFEGLAATASGSTVALPTVGLSTSSRDVLNVLTFGLQKGAAQTESYQLYAFTPGGGFYSTNVTYASIGDDSSDPDDITDNLRLTLKVTRSSTTNEFDFVGTLENLDGHSAVGTISNTLTQPAAWNADLYGYFFSGAHNESENFDLFDVDSFSYSTNQNFEAEAEDGADHEKINVVLFLIDDLSHYGVSAYGAETLDSTQGFFEPVPVETPSIDRLADEGVRFDHAIARPICEPTRVALMTGMDNRRNFVEPKSLHESQITFGDLFKRAGYATGIVGKWKQSRGTESIPAENYVNTFGWDRVFCYDLRYEGPRYIAPNFVDDGEVRWFTGINPDTGRRYYGPDLVREAASEFIRKHQDEPFFLYYNMLLVHDEHTPTPDTKPESVYDEFEVMEGSRMQPGVEFGAFPGDDRRNFPDMVAYMDKIIGKVVSEIDALGLRERTLIVVVGDNGTKNCFAYGLSDGTEFVGGKGSLRLNGIQVPLVVSMPGQVEEGGVYSTLTDITDILPTICEATGISLPDSMIIDGRSFWKQIEGGESDPHRETAYVWYNENRNWNSRDRTLAFATDGRFKLWAADETFPDGRFFDLETDPLETAGEQVVQYSWNYWLHAGLDPENLNQEARTAYEKLGKVLEANAYQPVESVKILDNAITLKIGESLQLKHAISPSNATVQNVIWESENPSVASVDKFGEVTAVGQGETQIMLWSWDDAEPVSNPAINPEEFYRGGINDGVKIQVRP